VCGWQCQQRAVCVSMCGLGGTCTLSLCACVCVCVCVCVCGAPPSVCVCPLRPLFLRPSFDEALCCLCGTPRAWRHFMRAVGVGCTGLLLPCRDPARPTPARHSAQPHVAVCAPLYTIFVGACCLAVLPCVCGCVLGRARVCVLCRSAAPSFVRERQCAARPGLFTSRADSTQTLCDAWSRQRAAHTLAGRACARALSAFLTPADADAGFCLLAERL
jgi:hypothetical protein